MAKRALRTQQDADGSYLAPTLASHYSVDQDLMDEEKVTLTQEMRTIGRSLSTLLATQSGSGNTQMSPSVTSGSDGQDSCVKNSSVKDSSVKKE